MSPEHQPELSAPSWDDDPKGTLTEDLLGRGAFVSTVVDVLDRVHAGKRSTVIGLVGQWGSGKTSIANFVLEGLARHSGPTWHTTVFNPWLANDAEALTGEFLASLLACIEDDDQLQGARRSLEDLAPVFTPFLKLIPFVGDAAADVATGLQSRRAAKPLATRLAEVSAQFAAADSAVLIVVDDVDRLAPNDLLTLLRVIRVLGRFENVHYLLLYDNASAIQALQRAGVAESDEQAYLFMDKLVQIRLQIPATSHSLRRTFVQRQIDHLASVNGIELWADEASRLHNVIDRLVARGLVSARSLKKFLTTFELHLQLVGLTEVDWGDFAAVSFLRTRVPEVFEALLQPRHGLSRIDQEDRGEILYRSVDKAPEGVRDYVSVVHSFLYNGGRDSGWMKRANDVRYARRYFGTGFPQDDVHDGEVQNLVEEAVEPGASADVFGDRLSALIHRDESSGSAEFRRALIVTKLLDLTEIATPQGAAQFFPVVLANHGLLARTAVLDEWTETLDPQGDAADGLLRAVAARAVPFWSAGAAPAVPSRESEWAFALRAFGEERIGIDTTTMQTVFGADWLAHLTQRLREHFTRKDEADPDFPVVEGVRILDARGRIASLEAAVREDVEAGRCTAAEIGSRFVRAEWNSGAALFRVYADMVEQVLDLPRGVHTSGMYMYPADFERSDSRASEWTRRRMLFEYAYPQREG